MIRSLIVAVALLSAIFLVSALGAPTRSAARPRIRPPVVQPNPARPGVIPDALPVRLSGSQLATAARRCATWAAKAGFPDTGIAHGRLTTAVAVALAETGCDQAACYNNSTRQACTPTSTNTSTKPGTNTSTKTSTNASTKTSKKHGGDSVYRGAWLVGGATRTGVSDTCAYQGRCNARAAYWVVAGYGTDLRPWTAYLNGGYRRYLTAAAHAVSILRQGALPSGVTGMCAEYVTDQPGAWSWLARCGRGSPTEQWTLDGDQLRTGSGLCLTASASTGPVSVEHCTGSSLQDWRPGAGFALDNTGAHLCLAARGSPAQSGTTLTVQRCDGSRGQRWFRP